MKDKDSHKRALAEDFPAKICGSGFAAYCHSGHQGVGPIRGENPLLGLFSRLAIENTVDNFSVRQPLCGWAAARVRPSGPCKLTQDNGRWLSFHETFPLKDFK